MADLSDAAANALLDSMLGANHVASFGGTVYMALFTSQPTTAGGTEPSGGAYARAAVLNNGTVWPAAADREKSNNTTITFTAATADWGTVQWAGLYSASTAGTFYGYGDLTEPLLVQSGFQVRIEPGGFLISIPES